MTDVSTFLSGHKPRTVTVALCPDTELLNTIAELHTEAKQAARTDLGTLADDGLDDINGRLEELRSEAEAKQYRFTLQSVGRAVWSILVDSHQPDRDKRDRYREQGARLDWDPDTFPPVAIAASLVSAQAPDGAVLEFDGAQADNGQVVVDDEAAELARRVWDEFEFGEAARLWQAVVELNVAVTQVPKSVTVSGRTQTSSPKSGQPETIASPDPSSSDVGSLAG